MNHIGMQHLMAAGLVHEIHKRRYTAFVTVFLMDFVFGIAQVVEPDHQSGVEERLLPQTLMPRRLPCIMAMYVV